MSEQHPPLRYPTPFAYAAACKALWKHRERADHAEAEVRRLRAAVDAALALHVPEDRGAGPRCLGCAPDTLFVPYPCATARALAPVADPDPHTTSDEETT